MQRQDVNQPEPRDGGREADQALLDALVRGEEGAFDALYAAAGPFVHRVALRTSGQASDAADVTQEAFLHLFEAAPRLRLTGRLTSYLYPVTVRLARRARERAGRFASDEDALRAAVESLSAAAPGSGDLEAEAALEASLRGLPPEQRETVLLRTVDELSVPETAAAMDVPEGTVKSRLHAGLTALRRALGGGSEEKD